MEKKFKLKVTEKGLLQLIDKGDFVNPSNIRFSTSIDHNGVELRDTLNSLKEGNIVTLIIDPELKVWKKTLTNNQCFNKKCRHRDYLTYQCGYFDKVTGSHGIIINEDGVCQIYLRTLEENK